MAGIDLYKLTPQEKRLIFTTTGERVGLPAYAVEKDWWVVQTLRIIFQMEIGEHLLFKGGTSLSKAWGIIDRLIPGESPTFKKLIDTIKQEIAEYNTLNIL